MALWMKENAVHRMRWQIELVFKRLKSLAQLGRVPKHDDRSSRAWLYGKLAQSGNFQTQAMSDLSRHLGNRQCRHEDILDHPFRSTSER